MKSVMLIAAVLFCAVGNASAGILNAVDQGDVIQIINASEPSISWGTDLSTGESVETATVSILSYSRKDLALGALRFGYSGEKLDSPRSYILGLEVVLPNIIRKLVPDEAKDWKANLKILTLTPSVMVFGGYDPHEDAEEEWNYGVTLGPKLSF